MPNSIWFILGMIAGQLLQIVVTYWFIPRRIMCQRCQGFGWTNMYKSKSYGNEMSTESITSVRCPDCDYGVITIIPIFHKIKTFRYNKWTKWLRK